MMIKLIIGTVFCLLLICSSCAHQQLSERKDNQLPKVLLEPNPPGQFENWTLSNESGRPIIGAPLHGLAWGYLEALSTKGNWVIFPWGCGTVSVRSTRLNNKASLSVSTYPPMGSGILPAGSYRFVIRFDFLDPSDENQIVTPNPDWIVSSQFEVVGFSSDEFIQLHSALEDPVLQKCTHLQTRITHELQYFANPKDYPQSKYNTITAMIEKMMQKAGAGDETGPFSSGNAVGSDFVIEVSGMSSEPECDKHYERLKHIFRLKSKNPHIIRHGKTTVEPYATGLIGQIVLKQGE
jgi:hypothetical protein